MINPTASNSTFLDFLKEGNLGHKLESQGVTGSGVPEETGEGMPTSKSKSKSEETGEGMPTSKSKSKSKSEGDKKWETHKHFIHGKSGVLFGDRKAIARWNRLYSGQHGTYKPKKIITNCVTPSEGGVKLNEKYVKRFIKLSKGGAQRRLAELKVPKFVSAIFNKIRGVDPFPSAGDADKKKDAELKRAGVVKPQSLRRPLLFPHKPDRGTFDTGDDGVVTSQSPARYGVKKRTPKRTPSQPNLPFPKRGLPNTQSKKRLNSNKIIPLGMSIQAIMEKLGKLKKFATTGPAPTGAWGAPNPNDPETTLDISPKERDNLTPFELSKLASHRRRHGQRRDAQTAGYSDDLRGARATADKYHSRVAVHKGKRGKKKIKGIKTKENN